MSDPIGFRSRPRLTPSSTGISYVMPQQTLRRVMAFVGRSIDDVVNDPIAKNQVWGYFKLAKQIERAGEVTELERQWNGDGSSAL
jgi:hypothetical protein